MKLNVNHPTILKFLSEVTNNILSNIAVDAYFLLPTEKKMGVLYAVFKLMKNSMPFSAKPTDEEMRVFIGLLCKRNEELENYEFAAILMDISNNFNAIKEVTRTPKKIKREPKRSLKSE